MSQVRVHLRRRSVFLGRTATEIVDSEHIASQVRLFLQTCDDLLPDAMLRKNILQNSLGIQEVGAEDGIDGGEGAAEVFGHEVGGDAAGEGADAVGEGR